MVGYTSLCLDWGGTVLNVAVELNGAYPIRTTLTRIAEPVIRCCFGEEGGLKEYRDCARDFTTGLSRRSFRHPTHGTADDRHFPGRQAAGGCP